MSEINLHFAYFGTPSVASETLEILASHGYIPRIIITSPDAPAGRGLELRESPVSVWAREHKIMYLKPEKIDTEFIEYLKIEFDKLKIELSVVVAYGKILPEELIQAPELGTINIHYSLLPRWRGASPLEACLLAGDEVTGVSIQQMAYKLDSGPILADKELQIDINDTKESLRSKLIDLGGNLLVKLLNTTLTPSASGISPFAGGEIQDESQATYCGKIKKEDGEIDPNGDDRLNYNKYRAFYGWPGIFFFVEKNGKRIRVKITQARFENNTFIIEKVIPEGKKETDYSNFLNTSK